MGFVFCAAPCGGCRQVFSFNPNKVPSVRDKYNVQVPICLACIDKANPTRKKLGLPLIIPDPDAYEPCDEEELRW